jgi:tetratricopeptide (TPR) repeat protein
MEDPMNRLALALVVALAPLVAASSASACAMYRPVKEELLLAKSVIEQGDRALQRNELRKALRHYNRAMSAKGDRETRARAAIKAGQVFARLGNEPQAVRRFERAIKIAPLFADGHQALAFAVLDTDPAKAIVHFEGALAASATGAADIHASLAIAYARRGDRAKAKSHLQQARLTGASVERIIAAEMVIEKVAVAAIAARS